MKRLFAIATAAALCLSLLPFAPPAVVQSGTGTGAYTFDISQGNITISSGTLTGVVAVTYGSPSKSIGVLSTQPITITNSSNCGEA